MPSLLRLLIERSINRWREGWQTGYRTETLYRFYALALILLTPIFGVFLQDENVYEPMSVRWLLTASFVLLVSLSYVPGFIKDHFVGLMNVLGAITLAWIIHVSLRNNLAPNHALTFLITAFTFILGTGVGSKSIKLVFLYVGVIAVTTLGTLPFMGTPEIEIPVFILNTLSGILIAVVIVVWALRKDQALTESHQRYQMFIQNSTEGIWRLELREPIPVAWPQDQQIEAFFKRAYVAEANMAQAKMYGVPNPNAFLGLPIDGMLLPDDSHNRALFHRIIANGYQMKDAETREKTLDGQERWFLNNVIAELEDGKVHRMWGIQRDITARKKADAARALSDQKLRLHAERSPMGFIEWNLNNEVISWNKAAERIFGFTADEVIGQSPVDQLVPSSIRSTIRDVRERVIEGKETAHDTNDNLTKDGRLIRCEWFNTPLIDDQDTVIGMASLVHDVTKREHMTEALRQSEKRYSSLFHDARAAIIIHDFEGHILEVNQSAVDLFGYDKNTLTTLHVRDLHPPYAYEASRKKVTQLAQADSLVFELDFQRKDASTFPAEVTVQTIHFDEKPVAQALVRDQTEKHLWTERTLRAQRLESLGTLASGIAHDLNNVLNPVLMGIDLLRTQHVLEETVEDTLENMESSAIRGAHLIKQVLAFSQGVEGHKTVIYPEDNIHELAGIIRQTFPRSIAVQTNLSAPLPTILADAAQFQQVLMNICVNARDAMPEGGTLTLAAEKTYLEELDVRLYPDLQAGIYLKLEVVDTGVGMSSETQEKLFEPFYTTKPVDAGPGLGLSVVLGIIRNHGGAIHVYSEEGVGTRFSMFWPSNHSQQEESTVSQSPSSNALSETLLVVDDEPALLQITQQALELEGYTVVTATNGREAWELFQLDPNRFDLVLTDMMMPDVDGAALIHNVRTLAPTLKIVTTSGLDIPPSTLEALNTPYFLPKPYRVDQLINLLHEVLA